MDQRLIMRAVHEDESEDLSAGSSLLACRRRN
jgi:hypothetical protein